MLRTSLPDSISLPTGEVLKPYVGGGNQREIISTCKSRGAKYRLIKVLHRNLRGKTDFHGQPYKPTNWVFTNLDELPGIDFLKQKDISQG